MATPSQSQIWINKKELPDFPIHIEFNNQLSNEERIWFYDLLIAGFYPKFHKIRTFAILLRRWEESNNEKKVAEVTNFFGQEKWELKEAFNYMLLGNVPPDNAPPNNELHRNNAPPQTLIPLSKCLRDQKTAAFTSELYADFGTRYDEKSKFRMILTNVVERKAIENRTYRYILYALYLYRTYSYRRYPEDTVPVRPDNNQIRQHFYNITLDKIGSDRRLFQQRALSDCLCDIRKYTQQLYYQDINIHGVYPEFSEWHCLILALRDKKPYYYGRPNGNDDNGRGILLLQRPIGGGGWMGTLTPFQILLLNICRHLRFNFVEVLLDFKLYLLHLPLLCHTLINISLEPWREFQDAQQNGEIVT